MSCHSYSLSQFWIIVNWTLRNELQWNRIKIPNFAFRKCILLVFVNLKHYKSWYRVQQCNEPWRTKCPFLAIAGVTILAPYPVVNSLRPIRSSGTSRYKYSLLMHGIKFESFAKFVFEWKNPIDVWVYLFAIYVIHSLQKRLYHRPIV